MCGIIETVTESREPREKQGKKGRGKMFSHSRRLPLLHLTLLLVPVNKAQTGTIIIEREVGYSSFFCAILNEEASQKLG